MKTKLKQVWKINIWTTTWKDQYKAAGQPADHRDRFTDGRYEQGENEGQPEPDGRLDDSPPSFLGGFHGEQGQLDQQARDRRPVSNTCCFGDGYFLSSSKFKRN